MKFIIDAQLPISLKHWLNENGQDAIHTRDLPKKNLTGDSEIIQIAEIEKRIIISKDSDFQKHRIVQGIPKKILMITTGNIVNTVLIRLFEHNFDTIKLVFEEGHELVELSNLSIIVHE